MLGISITFGLTDKLSEQVDRWLDSTPHVDTNKLEEAVNKLQTTTDDLEKKVTENQ